LRKGPEHIPGSWLLLAIAVSLLALASFSATVLIEPLREQDLRLSVVTTLLVLAFYGSVLFVTGYGGRLVQVLTAVIGCGAVLTFLVIGEFVLFTPLLGAAAATNIAALMFLWSVPVEGHIISRAIKQHWLVGIAIAVAAFILQLGLQSALTEQS
jgi:hypothetical protein